MPQKAMKRKLEGPALAPGGADRRDGGRVPRPQQVAIYPCHPAGLGRPIRASLTDASPTSIGLTCLGNVPVGSYFVLRVDQPSGPALLQVYRVVRCRAAGAGASMIGAEYDRVFTGTNPVAAAAPAPSTSPEAAPGASPEPASQEAALTPPASPAVVVAA